MIRYKVPILRMISHDPSLLLILFNQSLIEMSLRMYINCKNIISYILHTSLHLAKIEIL